MIKKRYLLIIWLLSLIITVLWTYENPEKISKIKDKIKLYTPKHEFKDEEKNTEEKFDVYESNHFILKIEKIASIEGKTSFLLNNSNKKNFNINDVSIFTQEGFELKKDKAKKLKINKNFTDDYNGGLKTIFFINNKKYGLVSSLIDLCYYAAIIDLSNGKELLKSECLPTDEAHLIDFNGLGSSSIHLDEKLLISIGTPTSSSDTIKNFAQNSESFFGKIIYFEKENFIINKLIHKNYSIGHRNPQGITKIKNTIFSVEHGPHGGDELNKIKFNFNYGWPKVSYGTRYSFDNDGISYSIGHKKEGFEEPIFALVPSVGISALNLCPTKLLEYYEKNCLMALSLYGNKLRTGKSILIYLLDENLEKIHSIEKISLDRPLRHFMTNNKNEIFEDSNGDIYLSSDNDGIYRVSFNNFRK